MNTLRQEFCDETNTPMGLDNEFDYIRWLEAQIQALRMHDVVRRSEQLKAFVDWWHGLSQEELVWYEGRYVEVFLRL
jgi:hypothetical protein